MFEGPSAERFAVRTLIALVIALSVFSADEITGPQPTLPRSSLSIETERGPVRFTVEFATTPIQQQRGLMFRRSLAPDAGMLFVMEKTARIRSG